MSWVLNPQDIRQGIQNVCVGGGGGGAMNFIIS